MELFEKVDATSYLSGPAAESYLDVELFKQRKISLVYNLIHIRNIPSNLTDFLLQLRSLIFTQNMGQEAKNYFKSTVPDKEFIK